MAEAFKTEDVGYIAHVQALARKYTAGKPEVSIDAFLANRRADSGE